MAVRTTTGLVCGTGGILGHGPEEYSLLNQTTYPTDDRLLGIGRIVGSKGCGELHSTPIEYYRRQLDLIIFVHPDRTG